MTPDDLYSASMRQSIERDGFDIGTCIDQEEYKSLVKLIQQDQSITRTLEVGCALGFSSVAIASAIAGREGAHHTVLDPFQDLRWKGCGRRLVEQFGLASIVDIKLEKSEYALPELSQAGKVFDFILIDGWHTFDHTIIDLFYSLRLLRVGGIVGIDDTNWKSVAKVLTYALNYPSLQVVRKVNQRPIGRLVEAFPGRIRAMLPNPIKEPLDKVIYGTMVFLRKTAPDTRNFDWYTRF